jgi:hypothetical protein
MYSGGALLQHPLPIGPLFETNKAQGDLILLFFGQRLAFFGNQAGRSCVICALG